MSTRLHWRRHCPGDHLAHAADLSFAEDGALLRLLDKVWTDGPLPLDVAEITHRIRGKPADRKMVRALLRRFFTQTPDGFISNTLADEREHAERVVVGRKKAGQAGGLAKAKHLPSKGGANA